ESAEAGYYSVVLDDYNIKAELTSTERTGIHKYSFAHGDSCRLFIDMMHRDELLYYDIGTIGDTVIYGYRVSKGWAPEQHCYFYAVFNKPFRDFTQLDIMYQEFNATSGKNETVMEQVQVFSLKFDVTDEVMIKVGISGVDCDGAEANLRAEAPHWNFEKYRTDAKLKWENEMAKLPLKEGTEEEKYNYYTALYHCTTTPNIWSDADGRFRGMDKQIHTANGYTRYTVFSLWDTFRALHPLLTTIEPERTRDFIRTFLDMYKESGHLPVWELAGNETDCMIGYHAVSVIADAYAKGITDFDKELALEAMVATATDYGSDKRVFEESGFLPSDQFSESVSKTLEYAYDDWCIATFAKSIGHDDVYERFIKRSQNWKNVFDTKTGFMRPRRNGGFIEPFDPYEVNFNYTEANAWQYQFFVPHDVHGLIKAMGGEEQFEKRLDNLFTAKTETTGREQADISGLIGQYAHGNEPSHHLAFLYNYTDSPEKCGKYVEEIMRTQYHNTPDGLCGNEDCGQMSAWYVLAQRDLYAFTPGSSDFLAIKGSLETDSGVATIHNKQFGLVGTPESEVNDFLILPAPVISGPQTSFKDSTEITISGEARTGYLELTYTIVEPETGETLTYVDLESVEKPFSFKLYEDKMISARYVDSTTNPVSYQSIGSFTKRLHDLSVITISQYDNQYNAGGNDALIDGRLGGNDFRTGAWQGFRGKDMEVVIDLGAEKQISSVSVSCLQEIKSWIWFPSEIEIFISHDGKSFASAGTIKNENAIDSYVVETTQFNKALRGYGRFVKVVAHPAFQSIPAWHLGAGDTCWIFADEIIIR
ncbi:MAG: GH92 family glycosyl hydrolase, partial [Flavobacteriales bacterium]